jgi:hypothetical protein
VDGLALQFCRFDQQLMVEKYDRMFADQVTTALSGDDGPNVEIVDLRGQLTRSGMQQLEDLGSSRSSSSKGRSS